MASSASTSVLCPVLIGRALHLETLSQILEQASDGAGQTVLIGGEAGIGKSRLVAEAKTYAAKHGFNILQGNCFEPDRGLPYAPLLDPLRNFCAAHSDAEIASAFGTNAADFVKLLPELSTRLPNIAPIPALDPEAEKHRLFNALLQFFTGKEALRRGPVLIVIEDLHWSDDTSLEFLLHLARRLVSLRIVLLLTYRSDETDPTLKHFLVELDRERLAMELRLQHLTTSEVDGMLRAIFQTDHPVSSGFRQTLYTLTEGNPFFIEETLKALIESGSIFLEGSKWEHKPVSELQIPRSIQDSVLRRSEQLTEEARHLLELAAVAGRRFDFDLLKDVTQLDEQKLLFLMKELVAAQLVAEESADQFSFRHALTREAVYHSLLMRERKRDHGLVAGTIERLYADSLEARAGNLAYHYYEAGAWDKALVYSQLAGEKAQALYAPHAAVDQFTRALEAVEHLGARGGVLYRKRGQSYETLGEFDKAQADYEKALNPAGEAQGDKSKWEALTDLGSLWTGRDYQRANDYFQQALDLAEQMGDPSTRAHSLNRLGNWHANAGDLSEALRYHRQALDVFQVSKDRHGLAETLDVLGTASQLNGDLVEGTANFMRAAEIFRELDDRQGLASVLSTMALCGPSYMSDMSVSPITLTKAVEEGEEAVRIAREIGWRSAESYALWCTAINLGPQGEYQRAMEWTQLAQDISDDIGHEEWTIGTHCVQGAIFLDLFALPQARQHLELVLARAQRISSSVWIGTVAGYLASVCILQDDLPRAEALLAEELTSDTPALTMMQRICWGARAELALRGGEPKEALRIIDRLLASGPNLTTTVRIPRVGKLRGDALLALGRLEEAEKELLASLATATQQGARAWIWRIRHVLGRLYQNQGRRPEAETEFKAARSIIDEIAARIQDEALRGTFLEQTQAMFPASASARQEEKEEFGGLTTRERQVAALIAKGGSNREIAETLVVSERTVESHVTNILAKLGFSSRARIAIWAAEKGLGKQAE